MSTKSINAAAGAFAAVVLFGTAAEAQSQLERPVRIKDQIEQKVACSVAGTPVEFPNGILIRNSGLITIPAGRIVRWTINTPKHSGTHTLTAPLAQGETVLLPNVTSGIQAGVACSAEFVTRVPSAGGMPKFVAP
jgi:hypothetical protein